VKKKKELERKREVISEELLRQTKGEKGKTRARERSTLRTVWGSAR